MSNLKDQQKKLLRATVAGKTMEYLMGLNENNKPAIRRLAEKSAKKIVKAYYDAIKAQHKKALKAAAKAEKDAEALTIAEPAEFTEEINLQAS